MGDPRRGFGLEIGFIDHINTRLVTTFNYSVIADLHTLQITTEYAKIFQSVVSSPVVPWLRLLTVGIFQLHRLPYISVTTDSVTID
jgi:hypothetical protein